MRPPRPRCRRRSPPGTPAPVTKRETLAMPVQPRSASCRVASGRPKLPPALITTIVGPITRPWAAFNLRARRDPKCARQDQVELGRPPTGRTLAGQPPARGPTGPEKRRSPHGPTVVPRTAEGRRGRQPRPPDPRRRQREHRVQTAEEDRTERQRLHRIEQDVVLEGLLGVPCMKPIHRQ